MKLGLIAMFGLTALLYASVGFGGGSTYTALLVLFDIDYRLIPVIALACNILVVGGNSVRYARQGLIDYRKTLPLIALSVPAAWMGARLEISEFVFIGLLWIALLLSGLRLIIARQAREAQSNGTPVAMPIAASLGAGIGFYAGLVGIGGGIFLAPILHFLRWGKTKTIAATCSLFILVNSIAGLSGQITKLARSTNTVDLNVALAYWPLLPAVFIGGFIGNHWGVFKLSDVIFKRLTGALILFVAIRLALRWFGQWFGMLA